jgi:cAMP-binding proteins - catabolite gene activator and regulatory subunit of cAMP-dependent protein kinases
LQRGEFIFKAGQRDLGLTVILRGETEVFEAREGTEQILATGRERDFIGDVAMLQGTSALATARVKSERPKFWKSRRPRSGARSRNYPVWAAPLSTL